jgi:hypothetical protein
MAIPANPVCVRCPNLALCGEEAVVHTCKVCLKKVCAPSFASEDTPLAPDECPQWHPVHASAWDCGPCRKELADIRNAHPSRPSGLEATQKLVGALFKSASQRDEQTVQEAIAGIMDSFTPFRHVHPTDTEFMTALSLVRQLVAVAMAEPEFQDEVARNETWDTSMHELEWAEAVVLARRRHQDAANVSRVWALVFTDRAPWSRAWVRVDVPRRRGILRQWDAVLRLTTPRGSLPEG